MGLFDGTPLERPVLCDRCNALEAECECPEPEETIDRMPPEKQKARIAIEKRKKGKVVTVVRGLHAADLPDLLTDLKSKCGAGGAIKEGSIEIQGKHPDRVQSELKSKGYRT